MTAAELLRKAQDEMRTRGFGKGELECSSGAVCLLGALNAAATGDPSSAGDTSVYVQARSALLEQAMRACGQGTGTYNDRYLHNLEDAVAALEKAAVRSMRSWA